MGRDESSEHGGDGDEGVAPRRRPTLRDLFAEGAVADSSVVEHGGDLVPRRDAELREDAVEVVLDRALGQDE